jgi:hypothetical protein
MAGLTQRRGIPRTCIGAVTAAQAISAGASARSPQLKPSCLSPTPDVTWSANTNLVSNTNTHAARTRTGAHEGSRRLKPARRTF